MRCFDIARGCGTGGAVLEKRLEDERAQARLWREQEQLQSEREAQENRFKAEAECGGGGCVQGILGESSGISLMPSILCQPPLFLLEATRYFVVPGRIVKSVVVITQGS